MSKRVLYSGVWLLCVHCQQGSSALQREQERAADEPIVERLADGSELDLYAAAGGPVLWEPFNEWWTEAASKRLFADDDPWMLHSLHYDWRRTEPPPSSWVEARPDPGSAFSLLEKPTDQLCADVELHCRFSALDATHAELTLQNELRQFGLYCDHYCGAQYYLCRGDELWDEAFRLPRTCGGEGCESEQSPTLDVSVDTLVRAAEKYYYAVALLMHAFDNIGPTCMEHHEAGIRLAFPRLGASSYESLEQDRYASKIVYALNRFEDAYLEATRRLVARADAGFGRTSPLGFVREWYGDDAPRSLAAQLLLGEGVALFPCTINPNQEGMQEGKRFFEEVTHRDPTTVPPPADPIWDLYGTTPQAVEGAIWQEAEQLKASRTSGYWWFPARDENSFSLESYG